MEFDYTCKVEHPCLQFEVKMAVESISVCKKLNVNL